MLTDNHGRPIEYLRLAVTDRCNLRCHYCMPARGIAFAPRAEVLSYEEMFRLLEVFAKLGIRKLRLTGGEPFVRRDLMKLIRSVARESWFEKISITTNGTMTLPHLDELAALGIRNINLSLDSLDRSRFLAITRRDVFDDVMQCMHQLMQPPFRLRINAVMMEGQNEEDFWPLVMLAQDQDVEVRFIEEMPFNGSGAYQPIKWSEKTMTEQLRQRYPDAARRMDEPGSTSVNYLIPGFRGSVGFIAAWTRSFCGTCNRIRLTPEGMLKTCLYDKGAVSLRDILRNGATDKDLEAAILSAIGNRFKNGHEAEQARGFAVSESMATIGG